MEAATTVNLNMLQKFIQRLNSQIKTRYGDIDVINPVTSVRVMDVKHTEHCWESLDDLQRHFEGRLSIYQDLNYMKRLLYEANFNNEIYCILNDIETIEKCIDIYKSVDVKGALSKKELQKMVELDYDKFDSTSTLKVSFIHLVDVNEKLKNLRQKLTELQTHRDELNNSVKVDISKLSDYSKELLGVNE